MAVNLFDLLENEFSADVISNIAGYLGEPPPKTQAAIANAVPAIVCVLHQKVQASGGPTELFGVIQRGGFDGKAIGSLASLVGGPSGLADLVKTGTPLLATVFGARQAGVIEWLANASGLGKAPASALLALAVPVVLNLLGRQSLSAGGFTAVTIANLIKAQGSFLSSIAPSGLAPVLGIGQCGEVVPAPKASIAPPPAAAREPAREPESGLGWLQWLLPLLLIPLLFIGWRSCRTAPVREVAMPAQPAAPAPAPTPAPAATRLVQHTLSCGQTLDVAEGGIEQQLVAFVDDKGAAIDPNRWFSFDRLEFETDSAVLRPSSQAQLRNIVEIMQCYPNVELKVGGYTDSSGDDADNPTLSQERAESTMRALVDLGAPAARLSAEGYGEQYPVATNDTDEGRQRNRRIDVSVRKK